MKINQKEQEQELLATGKYNKIVSKDGIVIVCKKNCSFLNEFGEYLKKKNK